MTTAQIVLTDTESQALQALSQRTGKPQDELLRAAVVSFLGQQPVQDRVALLRKARGIWKDRQDLPDFRQLRAEWDRLESKE